MKHLLVCLLWLYSYSALADTNNFSFVNDFFSPGGKDRFLTNQVFVSSKISKHVKIGLGNDMYTPDDLKNSGIPEGDHPWSGFSYISYQNKKPITADVLQKEYRLLELKAGMLGKSSGTKELQKFVHNDLGFGTNPLGWDTQNPSEIALDFIYGHASENLVTSFLGFTTLKNIYGFRAGNVAIEAFLDQKVNKKFFKLINLFAGMEGKLKAFDTHLDGRMFRTNTYTVDKEPFVASARAGISINIDEYEVGFMYSYQTETFKQQDGKHLFGSLFIKKEF